MEKNVMDYVKKRLDHWADWAFKHRDGIGYQYETLFEKMRRSGGHLELKIGQPVLIIEDKDAEEMEVYICELRLYKPLLADVICQQYLERGTVHQKAKRLKISYRTYMSELKLAYHWLAGRFVQLKVVGQD